MNAYHRPETLGDALALLAETPVTLAAGCTDLFPATEMQQLPGAVLDLTAIADLRGITATSEGWRIGATTTWSDVIAADLPPAFDMLKQAAGEVGSVQIQNAGTIAGNLCNASPAADGVPPLLALDAIVELASLSGRRHVPLAMFLTGVRRTVLQPGEIVSAIVVPKQAGQGRSGFAKLGARKYLVISIAMVAVRLIADQGKVLEIALSVGSCSAVAMRLTALETRLTGQPIAGLAAHIDEPSLADVLSPISDMRGDAAYRITAATELLRRTVADLSKGHST
ncbi:MAG: CO/xanthine dehydrogenase FAD-binding subunit [Paracoccaceae bacterium]